MKRSLSHRGQLQRTIQTQLLLNSPDQGAKARDGSEHVTTGFKEDDVALLEACLAIEEAAIVETSVNGDVEDELGAPGSDSGKGCQPEDHHDTVEDDDGNDVVDLVER